MGDGRLADRVLQTLNRITGPAAADKSRLIDKEERKMTTTTFAEFDKEYTAFARKHNAKAERREYTSLANGIIRKTICWSDGATWWEVTETELSEKVEAEVEIHGIKVRISERVPLRKTEYWSTESGTSKYYYERG